MDSSSYTCTSQSLSIRVTTVQIKECVQTKPYVIIVILEGACVVADKHNFAGYNHYDRKAKLA